MGNGLSANTVTRKVNVNAFSGNGSDDQNAFVDPGFPDLRPSGFSSAFDSNISLLDSLGNYPDVQPENLHNLWDIFGGADWDQLYPDNDQVWQ